MTTAHGIHESHEDYGALYSLELHESTGELRLVVYSPAKDNIEFPSMSKEALVRASVKMLAAAQAACSGADEVAELKRLFVDELKSLEKTGRV